MPIIKNPLTIVQTGGESQVPEYMSAKNFTFNGNACTGYVGDNSLPEIIIPRSYSTVSTVETFVGAKVLNKSEIRYIISDFQSATFSDGENNTHTYSSPSELYMLEGDFPNDCYLVSMEVSDVFNFDFLNQAYDMQILQFPININGQSFSDGMTAFDYIMQNNIVDINFGGDVEFISYIDGNNYQVTSVSSVNDRSGFEYYENRIILLSNITNIDDRAFYNCKSSTSIIIPESVTSIADLAFYSCDSLTSITIPEGVTSIGGSTFYGCNSLTSITLSSTLTSIESSALRNCSSLTSIEVNPANTNYSSQDGVLFNKDKTTLIQYAIGNTREEYTIPLSATTIGQFALSGCTSLTSITFGDNSQLTSIDNYAFYNCDALVTVTFGENSQLESIGSTAFQNCSNLTSIEIPSSVTSIGSNAFRSCDSLTTMTILATTPPKLDDINAISTATTKIYIPAGTLSVYQSATNWSNFADKFEELPA